MEEKEFEALVAEALDSLPEIFRQYMENVEVVIEDEPTREQAKETGAKSGTMLLGLYQGVPFPKRNHYYGGVMPDKITIFKNNIERACRTKEDIRKEIIHTIQHELAHYFGISDQKMKEEGTY